MSFLGRYAKALIPTLFAISAALERYITYGELDRAHLGLIVGGIVSSIAVAIVPNSEHPPSEHVPPGGEDIVENPD